MAININAINWDELKQQTVRKGLRRKTYHGENITITYNEAMPGMELFPHSHPHEQLVYWLSGSSDFSVDGVVYPMKAGSVMAIPPNVEHFGNTTGNEPAVNIDVFVPIRSEYEASEKIEK